MRGEVRENIFKETRERRFDSCVGTCNSKVIICIVISKVMLLLFLLPLGALICHTTCQTALIWNHDNLPWYFQHLELLTGWLINVVNIILAWNMSVFIHLKLYSEPPWCSLGTIQWRVYHKKRVCNIINWGRLNVNFNCYVLLCWCFTHTHLLIFFF